MNRSTITKTSRAVPAVALWLALTSLCLVLAQFAENAGWPASQLLIGTVAGAVAAALSTVERTVPRSRARPVQALIGVLMGSYLHPAALSEAVDVALASLAATVATIGVCALAALGLARLSAISTSDALLGLAPGGSASIISSAGELGGNVWQVAVMQYLRVSMVALTAPLLVLAVAPSPLQHERSGAPQMFTWPEVVRLVEKPGGAAPFLVLAAVCVLGAQLGSKLRLPAPALLGAALLTVVVTSTGTAQGFTPDGLLEDAVLVMTGLEVGLRFSRHSLRRTVAVLPQLTLSIVSVCVVCAGIAVAFAAMTKVGYIQAYLATTPGGINAVLATTASAGTDMTVVSTAQCIRLFVVALAVPLIVRWLERRAARPLPTVPDTA